MLVALDQNVFNCYRSMDCEDKTVVLERPKDQCFLSEADVGLPVDVLAVLRAC